jgi:hypothetical protein
VKNTVQSVQLGGRQVRDGLGLESENCQCEKGLRDEGEEIRFVYALCELGVEPDTLMTGSIILSRLED